MITLKVKYEKYDRIGGNFRQLRVSGEDLKDALLNMLDELNMYTDRESIYESEEEEGKEISAEEIIEMIEDQNGDGCDYIFELKDLNSGRVYIDNFED